MKSPRPEAQPKGLWLLFVLEMWERYSYYGMRALFVLFLIAEVEDGGWGWSVEAASRLYGWYTGLVYLTPVLGGYLADRYLGTHRAIVTGAVLIALGHFALALETVAGFYTGLALLIVGTGFFKSNVSTLCGRLYGQNDPRRDGGFTIFYMGINLGALIGPLVCGYLAESEDYGWRYGFGAAGVGMVLGLAVYLLGKARYLAGLGAPPPRSRHAGMIRSPLCREERDRIEALLVMAFFVTFFWLCFEQAGSSMAVFAERHTDRVLPAALSALTGLPAIPAAWFQSLNPAFILLLAPLFSWLWIRLAADGREPQAPVKMALGLILLGAGFVVLVLGALANARSVLVSPLWLAAALFLHTAGELCLSPVGLALVTRIAPVSLAAMLMGVWFLSSFVANLLGGYLAGTLEAVARGAFVQVLGGQADFFLILVVISIAAGLLLFMMAGRLSRLMHGRA